MTDQNQKGLMNKEKNHLILNLVDILSSKIILFDKHPYHYFHYFCDFIIKRKKK